MFLNLCFHKASGSQMKFGTPFGETPGSVLGGRVRRQRRTGPGLTQHGRTRRESPLRMAMLPVRFLRPNLKHAFNSETLKVVIVKP